MGKTGAAIIKRSLIYTPFFGMASWLIGSIFVDRAGQGGREQVMKAGEDAKRNDTKLFMYPEGTRNSGKNLSLLPFKKDSKKMIFNNGKATIRALAPIDTSE